MALRAGRETIGTAFVRILADGSGLPQSIKDEFHDNEQMFVVAGQEADEAFSDGYRESHENNQVFTETMLEDIRKGMGKISAAADDFGDEWQDAVRNEITKGLTLDPEGEARAREIGDRVVANIVEGMNRGQKPPNFAEDLARLIGKAVDDIVRDEKRLEDQSKRSEEATARAIIAIRKRFDDEAAEVHDIALRMNREFDKIADAERAAGDRMNKDWDDQTKRFLANLDKITKGTEDFGKQFDPGKMFRDIARDFSAAADEVKKFDDVWDEFGDRVEGAARRNQAATKRIENDTHRVSDAIAKVFGKGSRNDFFNILGRLVGAAARFGEIMGGLVVKGIDKVATALGFAGKAGEGAIGTFLKITEAALGIATGVGSVLIALGFLVAGIAELGGALIALVSTLTFAAASAIPLLVGGFAALAAAVGVAVLAFQGFKQFPRLLSELHDVTAPLVATFDDFQRVAAHNLFPGLTTALPLINAGLATMRPLIAGVATALGDVAVQFGLVIASSDFQKFTRQMGQQLPDIIRNLGTVAAQGFKGFLGVIRASLPFVEKFSGWLANITTQFATWANSTKGQNWLSDFFTRAEESAQAVWDVLGALGGVIADLLGASQQAGNGLFESMADTLNGIGDWLDAHPDALHDFFDDAAEAARNLGELVLNIVAAFAALNTDENRDLFNTALKFAAQSAADLAAALRFVDAILGPIVGLFSDLLSKATSFLSWTPLNPFLALKVGGKIVEGLGSDIENELTGKLEDAGVQLEHTGEGMVDTSQHVQTLTNSVKKNADAIGLTVHQYSLVTQATESFKQALEDAQRTGTEKNWLEALAASLGEVGTNALSATDAANDFATALHGLVDPELDAVEASDAWSKAIRTLGDDLSKNTTDLEGNTAGAAKNRQAIIDRVRALEDTLVADAKAGATQEELTAKMEAGIGVIKRQAIAHHLDADEVQNLLEKFHLTPEKVETIMRLIDMQKSQTDVDIYHNKLDDLPDDHVVTFNTLGADRAAEQARAVDDAVRHIPTYWATSFDAIIDKQFYQLGQSGAFTASGGVFHGAQRRIIAEAGAEAVVPLNRPLSMVDPSVRWLSAIAQGKSTQDLVGDSNTPKIDVGGITIITPVEDPAAVAQEVVNRLAVSTIL